MLKCFKAFSDQTRLRIFRLLQQEPLSVAELQEILNMGQSSISSQLSMLKSVDLVIDERSGKFNIYRAIASPSVAQMAETAANELPENSKDQLALQHLLNKRKDKSRLYFDTLAGKFGKEYVPGRSWKGLAEALLKILNYDVVADLGSGEGTLAQLLAQRAKKVIAVDLSPKMVAFGQQLAEQNGLANLEFRIGDIEAPPIDPETLDLAILSQALHHAENPKKAIQSAYQCLKKQGKIIILDLLKHHIEEVREMYADRWLGFSESELMFWMQEAGFTQIEIILADTELNAPYFQTILVTAVKG